MITASLQFWTETFLGHILFEKFWIATSKFEYGESNKFIIVFSKSRDSGDQVNGNWSFGKFKLFEYFNLLT